MTGPATVERAAFTPERIWGGADPITAPGELLTMPDGVQWFHPYSGAAPVKITNHNRGGLTQ